MTEPEEGAVLYSQSLGPIKIAAKWHDGDSTYLITKHRGRNGVVLGLVVLPRQLGERI